MDDVTKETTAIDTLRAMYRSVRGGAALDAPAYVDALLEVAADGGDTVAVVSAFERLGYWTRLDILGMGEGAGAHVQAAKTARGWKGAARVASLLGITDVWAAAMAAHYGPAGTHISRLGADGVPTVETLADFPRIAEAMTDAEARFDRLVTWHIRQNAGKAVEMRHVVRYSAPVKAA